MTNQSLYKLLTSGYSHRFHIGSVLAGLASQFHGSNLTFLGFVKGYHVKYLSSCYS